MTPPAYLRTMLRESRGSRGRLAFFVACLAVGVAAVVAVAGLAAGLDTGLRREARRLLAADLAVSGNEPVPEVVGETLDRAFVGTERAEILELPTMVSARRDPIPLDPTGERPEQEEPPLSPSQLVELKVVSGPYPFYGDLVVTPARPLAELLAEGAVAAPELLERLGLAVGDRIAVGGIEVPVAGVVTAEPDRLGGAFGFSVGPRLFLSAADFARTGLEQTGSRIRYRLLVRLPEGAGGEAAERAAAALRPVLPENRAFDVETWSEAQPALRAGVARSERFLGLVALLSLFIGGIGVGQTIRAWLAGRLDAIAVLKCLGFRPREVFALYAGQTALLGLAGSVVGALVGLALLRLVPYFAADLVPVGLLDPWQPGAVGRGVGLGLGVALLFGLPSLGSALRVPPARVLRRTAEPLPVPRWLQASVAVTVLLGIWGTAAIQASSWRLGLQFTGGTLAAAAALALAARAITALVGRLPRRGDGLAFALRHGLASLVRPGAGTQGAVVALGLGTLVVIGLWSVERGLTAQLAGALPENAPSVFLVDIQPAQWTAVQAALAAVDAQRIDSVPVVTARLAAIDGVGVDELAGRRPDAGEIDADDWNEGERRWALTREQRLTYLETLPADNRIVAGTLWSDPAADEVSVEADFASDLGVRLGSTLTFDIQGVPTTLEVTSLRTVDWSTFGINFFLVVEPGVLERAPQFRIAAADVAPAAEIPLQDRLAAEVPNVTVLRIREVLEKVVRVLRAVAGGIRFVGAFTVLAGIAILGGAVSASAARRGREVALLKTLGATRATVVAAYAVEYCLIGLVAGVIGSVGGAVLSWAVLTRGMDVDWVPDLWPVAAGIAGAAVLTVVAGLGASTRALQARPIAALRR